MREFSKTFLIEATRERVWDVMRDVERWPEWTSTVTSIERKDAGPFAVGSQIVIRQPKLPPALWTVIACEPGASFTWASRGPGVVVTAHHFTEAILGGTKVTLSIAFSGLLGGVVAAMTAGLNKRYLAIEAAGLRERCESPIAA